MMHAEAPKSIMRDFNDNSCLLMAQKHFACIEFLSSDLNRQGFHASQLLHYRLGANDDERNDATPKKLSIVFATANVTLTGWRLNRITEHLRDGDLLAVRAFSIRYANVDPTALIVANITVEPMGKG